MGVGAIIKAEGGSSGGGGGGTLCTTHSTLISVSRVPLHRVRRALGCVPALQPSRQGACVPSLHLCVILPCANLLLSHAPLWPQVLTQAAKESKAKMATGKHEPSCLLDFWSLGVSAREPCWGDGTGAGGDDTALGMLAAAVALIALAPCGTGAKGSARPAHARAMVRIPGWRASYGRSASVQGCGRGVGGVHMLLACSQACRCKLQEASRNALAPSRPPPLPIKPSHPTPTDPGRDQGGGGEWPPPPLVRLRCQDG